ncbi:hypothetical protein G7Z17_g2696 [Cylindrodendrum hubeiense]|uniref:LysM domain-containing protein n=1 Tax=Cylindrodendrum hubeiense TaxID=595255 RepID=A0A9P5LK21_9HYPO|nr:hypothetical protein G7Z17_g2696 [Cylindrodendrum hubeiense]
MQLTYILAAGFLPQLLFARHVPSRRAVECDFTTTADSGATCSSFASSWGLSVETLQSLNPGITCPSIDTSKSYCVMGTVTADPTTTSKTSTTTSITTTSTSTTLKTSTTTTSTTMSAAANSPTMPGLADDCDGFHKVSSGDQCDTIAAAYSISVAQFKTWNTYIDDNCSNLWLDYYVCVHTPGASTTTSTTKTSTTTTSTTTSATSYSPTMPGLISTCDGFYKVSSGDLCDTIASKYSITVAQFKTWNTYIDDNCSNLWLDYYVCVHVPGATTTTSSTTTSSTATTTTTSASIPSPTMSGIISTCKSYYQVQSGDSCWSIYSAAGITLSQFLSYNTAVDSSCSNLWLGYYVCIGV